MERRDYVVIKATVSKYDNLFDYHEDMGMVLYENKFGFIDKEGREVVKTIYDDAKNYSCGFAAVKKNNDWFFIDKKGEKVSSNYEFVSTFKQGYALVKKDNKWGIINTEFKEVIPTIYDSIDYPSNDLVVVSLNGNIKYVTTNNEVAIEVPNYIRNAYSFKNGIARLQTEDYKVYYIDKTGRKITSEDYVVGSDFANDLASVTANDGTTVIYRNGSEIFPRTKDFTLNECLPNGNFGVSFGYRRYGLINRLGEVVTKKVYTNMYYVSEKLIRVQDETNNYGFIDIDGKEVIKTTLYNAGDFSCGLSVVRDKITGKYGYIDRNGQLVIPFIYDMAKSFSDNMAVVRLDGNIFYIDRHNNVLYTSETKKKQIKVEAPGSIPMYVQGYNMETDFLRYVTELRVSDQYDYKVIATADIDKVMEHEQKVIDKEAEILTSMENLTKSKTLVKQIN